MSRAWEESEEFEDTTEDAEYGDEIRCDWSLEDAFDEDDDEELIE